MDEELVLRQGDPIVVTGYDPESWWGEHCLRIGSVATVLDPFHILPRAPSPGVYVSGLSDRGTVIEQTLTRAEFEPLSSIQEIDNFLNAR